MILRSKVRTSASKTINLMALIRTLTISTTTFKRLKEKLYGFRQTELEAPGISRVCQEISGVRNPHKLASLFFCSFEYVKQFGNLKFTVSRTRGIQSGGLLTSKRPFGVFLIKVLINSQPAYYY